MSRAGLNDVVHPIPTSTEPAGRPRSFSAGDPSAELDSFQGLTARTDRPRRTPRTSLIVVLPDKHFVLPDRLAERLPTDSAECIDVIVACAGQPVNLNALQRRVRNAQFLLAPAGTSTEDLRELAMKQAPGDIVSLLCGVTLQGEVPFERERLTTS